MNYQPKYWKDNQYNLTINRINGVATKVHIGDQEQVHWLNYRPAREVRKMKKWLKMNISKKECKRL